MSYEQFWYNEAELYWAYQTAFIRKQKLNQENENNFAWLYGLYVYNAFSTVEYNINREKGQPYESYLEKPIDFNKSKEEIIQTEQSKFENKMKAFIESKKIALDKKKGTK